KLTEIYETGANDVMVVQGDERHLIPLVWEHYLLDVDLDQGVIRVDWQ
ncbi:MAG: ribosome maturation factor RimM, partial [Gammaproteobacteria bacterium]|nr:ribosome maturation factor RimM [Gammaproteobacteria bacterium]